MSISKIVLLLVLGICLIAAPQLAQLARAELNTDLRVKLGGAAGIDKAEITNIAQTDVTQKSSGNFQIELVMSPKQPSGVSFVGSIGLFGRNHVGNDSDPFSPTEIEYSASGLSASAGASFGTGGNLHFETRLELAVGTGKPTLTTPGFVWNSTKEGSYSATSLILGGYYTLNSPGLQLGLELGGQSFVGNFQIWNNSGFWSDGKVEGSGSFINLVVGYRF